MVDQGKTRIEKIDGVEGGNDHKSSETLLKSKASR